MFTNKEGKEAQLERKEKERKNLEYNQGIQEIKYKNKLEFLKTEDL